MRLPRPGGLWHNPDFVKLWAGQTVSVFGSLVSRAALSFTAVLLLGATPRHVALLNAADLVPGLLFGLFAGVWVDRLARRPILIGCDVGRALLLASIPVAALWGRLTITHLAVVAFLGGALTVLFDVAYAAYLPSLVKSDELVEGNSKLTASASVAEFGAFSLSGWLVQWVGGPLAALVDAASFVASALFVGSIRLPEKGEGASPPNNDDLVPGVNLWAQIVEGLQTVWRDPRLRALALGQSALDLLSHIVGTVYLVFVTKTLGFSPGVLGMIFAVGGVTSLAGALLAGRVTKRFGVGGTLIGGLIVTSIGSLFLPLAPGATLLGAAFLLMNQVVTDPAWTVFEINATSLRQAVTPDALRGRVNGTMRVLSLGMALVGTFAGGVLGETLGVRAALGVGVCGGFVAAVFVFFSPVRSLRAMPSALPSL